MSGRVSRRRSNPRPRPGSRSRSRRRVRSRSRSGSRPRQAPVLPYVTHEVSKTNPDTMLRLINTIHALPIYLISAHSCISKQVKGQPTMAEYGAIQFPFAFTIPERTFIISFSEPGSATCSDRTTEEFIQTQSELIRQFLYLHGADEFEDHREGSIFARATRATGGTLANPIEFPNINYTFEPDTEGVSRDMNTYGVFDISNPANAKEPKTNLQSIIAQFDPTLPADTTNKTDWPLGEIIQRVYQVTGRREGIFLNMGCHTACKGAEKSLDIAANIMRYADIMYRNIIPIISAKNIRKQQGVVFKNHTHLYGHRLNTMEPSTFKALLDQGLYHPRQFLDSKILYREFHPLDDEEIKKIAQRKIAQVLLAKRKLSQMATGEFKSKLRSKPKANPRFLSE